MSNIAKLRKLLIKNQVPLAEILTDDDLRSWLFFTGVLIRSSRELNVSLDQEIRRYTVSLFKGITQAENTCKDILESVENLQSIDYQGDICKSEVIHILEGIFR